MIVNNGVVFSGVLGALECSANYVCHVVLGLGVLYGVYVVVPVTWVMLYNGKRHCKVVEGCRCFSVIPFTVLQLPCPRPCSYVSIYF